MHQCESDTKTDDDQECFLSFNQIKHKFESDLQLNKPNAVFGTTNRHFSKNSRISELVNQKIHLSSPPATLPRRNKNRSKKCLTFNSNNTQINEGVVCYEEDKINGQNQENLNNILDFDQPKTDLNKQDHSIKQSQTAPVPMKRTSLSKKTSQNQDDEFKFSNLLNRFKSTEDIHRVTSTISLPNLASGSNSIDAVTEVNEDLNSNFAKIDDITKSKYMVIEDGENKVYVELRKCSSVSPSFGDDSSHRGFSDLSFITDSEFDSDSYKEYQGPSTLTNQDKQLENEYNLLECEYIQLENEYNQLEGVYDVVAEDDNDFYYEDEVFKNMNDIPFKNEQKSKKQSDPMQLALVNELSAKFKFLNKNEDENKKVDDLENETKNEIKNEIKNEAKNEAKNETKNETKNDKPTILIENNIDQDSEQTTSSNKKNLTEDLNTRISLRSRPNISNDFDSLRESEMYIIPENIPEENKMTSKVNICELHCLEETKNESTISYLEFDSQSNSLDYTFDSEPLYQFYQKDVHRRAELWIHADKDHDSFLDDSCSSVNQRIIKKDCMHGPNCQNVVCKSPISAIDFAGTGPNRTLWAQHPQIIRSNVLNTLTSMEIRLQENLFEILTSEASNVKSLKILVTHFLNCPEFSGRKTNVLSSRERDDLFSNVKDIYQVSLNLLNEFEKRLQKNIFLVDICDILYKYAENHFCSYIHYCKYQADQDKLLRELKRTRPEFAEVLTRLESNAICQMQSLQSFLLLPVQRIMRYPMLVEKVYDHAKEDSPIYKSCERAFAVLNKLVNKCNEETRKVQQMQELLNIRRKLEFGSGIKSYPIISESRYLVKNGKAFKMTLSKKSRWSKSRIHLFLFTDVLFLTKENSSEQYIVFDYCLRNLISIYPLDSSNNHKNDLHSNYSNLARLVLHSNSSGKNVEFTLSFNKESELTRWIEAFSSPISSDPNVTIYTDWDHPQVQCVEKYTAKQSDELSLEKTDVVNITKKTNDGWYEGVRIRDGVKGWFPANFTEEIINQHVIARNVKLRNRFLMITESYLEQKNNKNS